MFTRVMRFNICVLSVALAVGLSLGAAGASAATAARQDEATVNVLWVSTQKPAWDVIVPNFERVYPNVKVVVSYASTNAQLYQLLTTQLAAGNGPDIVASIPGDGQALSVLPFARAGYLAPQVKRPWIKRLVPLVTSLDKMNGALYAWTPGITVYGIVHNDDLFKQLGLKVPQTFSQLLDVCGKAKAAGKVAFLLPGGDGNNMANLVLSLAVPTVYAKDRGWTGKLKKQSVSFSGTAGWTDALNHLAAMNSAGCFEQGAAAVTVPQVQSMFAAGQGLMFSGVSGILASLDALKPTFKYTMSPFPGGTSASDTTTYINPALSFSINSKSSVKQAAQTFVDFVARPKQNALYAKVALMVSQDDFLHGTVPSGLSSFSTVFKNKKWVVQPLDYFWNSSVVASLMTNAVGLVTGQKSVSDILQAMDTAWNLGPTK